MKIGIITVPFNNNYGGFLQAYALKTVLLGMKHEVTFISRQRNRNNSILSRLSYFLVSIGLRKDKNAEWRKKISVNTDRFKTKYLYPITEDYYSHDEIKKSQEYNFDAYIVGSDQCWRYGYAWDSIDDFYLSFLSDERPLRISYAASFGIDVMDYPLAKLELCAKLIEKFDSISVREESGIELLVKYFNVDHKRVKCVLDPTLLLTAKTYISNFDLKHYEQSSYLLTYILDENVEVNNLVKAQSAKMQLPVQEIKAQTGEYKRIKIIEPVESWLEKIYNARFIITDSYHGTIFSIIFNKPFIVYCNKTRGLARLRSLLSMLNLENRLIESVLKTDKVNSDIDWTFVNNKVLESQRFSLSYLKNALSKSR